MSQTRYDAIDALRGIAIVWMMVFHFCYDLNHFSWIKQNFLGDPFWTLQRTAIVTLFLFCAGFGQAIAAHQGQSWVRFGRRWCQVAGCALLVSVGSWWMFPQSYIYFGVLHGIAVMLLMVRASATWGLWLWPLGAMALALPSLASTTRDLGWGLDFLNTKAWSFLGLASQKPRTEDYVPVFPWLGIMYWGMATAQWVMARHLGWLSQVPTPAWLSLLGRWSLSIYMLHQPLFMGALMAVGAMTRP